MTTTHNVIVIDEPGLLTSDEQNLLTHFPDVQQITLERLLKGGLSGAKIVVADVKFGTEALIRRFEGPKIIKMGPAEEIKREVDNHTEARQGIEAHTPELILWTQHGDQAAMILQIAGGSADQITSLNDLIKDRRHEEVVKAVARFCTEVMGVWTPSAKLYELRHDAPAGAWFNAALNCGSFSGDRPAEVLALGKAITGDPLPEELWVRVDGHKTALPNPAILLNNPELWGKAVVAAPRGKIHGDLHSGNLISPFDSLEQTPALIDFGRFQRDGLLFFDLAYLELDLLLHRMADREASEWLRLMIYLMSTLSPQGGVGDGYEYCASLRAGAIRSYIQAVIRVQPPDLRKRFEGAWWLAATAAGLVFSRRTSYREEPDSPLYKREARLCYLYSAFALRQLIQPFNIVLGEHSQPVLFYVDPPQSAATPTPTEEIAPPRALEQSYAAALRDHFRELALEFTELGAITRPETLNAPAAEIHPDRRPLTPFNKRFGARPQRQDYSRTSRGMEGEGKHQQPVRDLRETLAKLDRLVLLGEPGAGKTTTLMRLTYEYAARLMDEPESLIPVFVALGEYRGTTEEAFRAHVQAAVEAFAPDLAPHTRYLLKHQRLILLCDALNEMSAEEKVLSSLQKALRGVSHVILSCREKDFSAGKLIGAGVFHQVDIQPLTPPQIREMIGRFLVPDEAENPVTLSAEAQRLLWERELQGSDLLLAGWAEMDGAGERDAFWVDADPPGKLLRDKDKWRGQWLSDFDRRDDARRAMLRDKRGLMLLCRNPFMLSMVIQTFHAQGTLPENRGALYESFVLALLERDKLAVRDDAAPEVPLRTTPEGQRLITSLMRLAEQMQLRQNITDYPRNSALEVLGEAESGLEALRQAVGCSLLVDKGSSVGFTHQLLAEYFASKVMGDKFDQGIPAHTIWKPEQWWERTGQEVTAHLLAGSRAAVSEAELIKVIQWLGAANPELAYEAAVEAGLGEEKLTAILNPPAQAKAEYNFNTHTWGKVNPDPHGRASAWRVLGKLREDKRPGVLDFKWGEDYWCPVPKGEFQMDSDRDSDNPKRMEKIDYDFWIAKYPITYAQFQLFIDAPDGYRNPDWWKDLHADGIKQQQRGAGEQYFKFDNHPAENVSWYEAMAFCRWLNTQPLTLPSSLSLKGRGRDEAERLASKGRGRGEAERLEISPALEARMQQVARDFRKSPTPSEALLWDQLRDHQLAGRKFRRQHPVGPFILDFYCAAERLAVEVDGRIHETQREADAARQTLLESLGIRFVRIPADALVQNLPGALAAIRAAFFPSPLEGEGQGVRGSDQIRLPLETEWEKAASWDAKVKKAREYPWEGAFDATKANTSEGQNIGQTTAVGIYPQGGSPYGALDMSGNVWEWCLNEYHSGKVNIGSNKPRVLRGGSWYHDDDWARAASRHNLDPYSRYNNRGFRVVVAPVSL